ncbi:hypothetical protein TYM08_P0758 [Marinicellulosiphila megalodicopiae]
MSDRDKIKLFDEIMQPDVLHKNFAWLSVRPLVLNGYSQSKLLDSKAEGQVFILT